MSEMNKNKEQNKKYFGKKVCITKGEKFLSFEELKENCIVNITFEFSGYEKTEQVYGRNKIMNKIKETSNCKNIYVKVCE